MTVNITENGTARQVTVFEVILLQLLKKVADGGLRAKRLLDLTLPPKGQPMCNLCSHVKGPKAIRDLAGREPAV